ncbi:jg15010 [Pararge aegeria aegeria]|uniref:Jg15010 protein n=1 Tax=Pararge aegeria aegeria TaxID=348720 RepID=A0A8S4QL16_9NEOP|nr:jg15010 [Pararge aegeria aegeria]
MESTGGVRFRVASTIHSKFVFSQNRSDGGRPSDRLLKRAPTCSLRQFEMHDARWSPDRGLAGGSYVRNCKPRRVTTVSKINVHAEYDADGRHMCALPSASR